MKPLIFGYMRVPDDMSDAEARKTQDELDAYAETNGYQLATVFHEYVPGSQSAFTELVDAVRHAEATHVIVPSYRELALNRSLQDAMLTHLSHATGAEVVSLDDLDGRS
ncbi:recombinase family protein [Streptomyces sp. J2-1]|uniref:recombinase family protein n=1 Tax=Streptomyces corallincola TaxID=2851888 RepID=UPI001C380D1A|nr:recombinase family protein [Streptomyces corallincola]MBV2355925.1 recombinase family protein [Streptomyces corallincola]